MKRSNKFIILCLIIVSIVTMMLSGCNIEIKENLNSIVSIIKTDTNGLVDTYTITFSDGTTSNFTVTNGSNGSNGSNGQSVTIDAIFQKWLEENPNGTYSQFLKEYLNINGGDNSAVVNKALLSSLKVYSEFTLSYNYTSNQGMNYISMSSGSAVIYKITDEYTYFITNYHVVYNKSQNKTSKIATKMTAYIYGSESAPIETEEKDSEGYIIYDYGYGAIDLEYVGGSATCDIAVLKAPTSVVKGINPQIKEVEFASSYSVGETAIAIGNPDDDGISVTQGVISMDNEFISLSTDGTSRTYRSIRIDTPLYPGNSGGGLFNKYGQIIGITNAGNVEDQNVNYAIPLNIVKNAVENIYYYKNGFINKITLGVTVQKGDSKYVYDEVTGLGKVVGNIDVVEITENSISQKMGLQVDDKLTAFNVNGTKYALNQYFDIGDYLYLVKANDVISFDYIRGEETKTSTNYTVRVSDINSIA